MRNLVLVGFSCSGKSTVGRYLARRLGLQFVDTDRVIEETAGRSIPDIFAQDGEDRFRQLEQEAVIQVCESSGQVVSTGGGAFVDPASSDLLLRGNLVIHLQIEPDTVMERLRGSRSGRPRPLLAGADPMARVEELMRQRRGAYERAHVTVSVDRRSQYDLVAELTRRWHSWQRQHQESPSGSAL